MKNIFYYQIFWHNYDENDIGNYLGHKKEFTQEEFDNLVQEAKNKIGKYYSVQDIEDYLINNFEFEIIGRMFSEI